MLKYVLATAFLSLEVFWLVRGDAEFSEEVKSKLDERIVNGVKAQPNQFPYLVSLRRPAGNHFCAGSIITHRWILTAAHCMQLPNYDNYLTPKDLFVIAGENSLIQSRFAQKRFIQVIKVHPRFDRITLINDVALLKTNEAFIFNWSVKNIPLATMVPAKRTLCTVSGWGYPKENGSLSIELMYANVPLVDRRSCRSWMKEYSYIPKGMICAGYEEGGKDACTGDSGGGLICNEKLTGVVSSGVGCANPRHPGLYADVCHYLEWIQYTIKSVSQNSGQSPNGSYRPFNSVSTLSYNLLTIVSLIATNCISRCLIIR